jgi:hypothetical protein
MTNANLAISDGWIEKPPNPIHRRAPSRSIPIPGIKTKAKTKTANSSTNQGRRPNAW